LAPESVTTKRLTWTVPNWLPGSLGLLSVGAAIALLILGWSYTASTLVIEVDGHPRELRTHATTVGEALRRAGLELYPEDRISPEPDTPLQAGMVIQVEQARPVALNADGQVRQLRTHARTTGELLSEAGLQLGPADEIWLGGKLVGPDAPLSGPSTPRQVSYRGGTRSVPDTASIDPPLLTLRRATALALSDDGVVTTLHTTLSTVGQVLQAHSVTLFLGDKVTPNLEQSVTSGMTIEILRSVPVQIQVDGHIIHTRTRAQDVVGVLGQEQVALVGQDRTEPGLAEAVRPNMTIAVTRVREELVVEFQPIPFVQIWVPDPELEIDQTRLVQPGQPGLNKQRQRVVYENGQEVERFLEDSWTDQAPITRTMAYGTKIVVRTLQTPNGPIEYWRKMRVYTTSYKPASCGKPPTHPRYGYTGLGWKLQKGIVAVDPTVIPLRSKMYVPGYGLAQAGDTGGGVLGKFVDLGFSDNDYESWHWWTDIYLLTPVPPSRQIRWILPNYPKFPDRKR
jgi:uncharacterized protein YabE (DUF348 family)